MVKFDEFDFGKIKFDADPVQVISLSHGGVKAGLPIRKPPINFSVFRTDGLFSKRWGVNTNGKGDAYIYCRDDPDREKVSLHASGRQHISLSGKALDEQHDGGRVGPVWIEPDFSDGAVATFSLIFPPWGLGIKPKPRKRYKDELLIVGHREKFIVIRFFVVEVQKNLKGSMPHVLLGKLPLAAEKELQISACKDPDNGLMERIKKSTFPEIASTFHALGHKANIQNEDIVLDLVGFLGPNSAFMLSVPVKYTPKA